MKLKIAKAILILFIVIISIALVVVCYVALPWELVVIFGMCCVFIWSFVTVMESYDTSNHTN